MKSDINFEPNAWHVWEDIAMVFTNQRAAWLIILLNDRDLVAVTVSRRLFIFLSLFYILIYSFSIYLYTSAFVFYLHSFIF